MGKWGKLRSQLEGGEIGSHYGDNLVYEVSAFVIELPGLHPPAAHDHVTSTFFLAQKSFRRDLKISFFLIVEDASSEYR
jgi:hypothetical protein